MQLKTKKRRGFTLLESLLTLAIIGIIATIAYPLYNHYVLRVNRTEAKVALQQLSAKLEQYYVQHHTYLGAKLSKFALKPDLAHGNYQLQIQSLSSQDYLIAAVPINKQAHEDKGCGTLTLNQSGQEGVTGSDTIQRCWGR